MPDNFCIKKPRAYMLMKLTPVSNLLDWSCLLQSMNCNQNSFFYKLRLITSLIYVRSLLNAFCLIVVMPIISGKMKLHDSMILFIISLAETLASALTPLATKLWHFYLIQAVASIGYCKYSGNLIIINWKLDQGAGSLPATCHLPMHLLQYF